jgi:polysaccharide biosynthesis PFTS motif protein
MFYLPQEEMISNKVYDVVIFDVTPYESSFKSDFEKISFSQNSIYSCYFAIKFLQEILWAKNEIERSLGIKLRIALKPKRKYTPLHSRDYLTFLENSSKNGSIEILAPELDLYKTISESRMILCYPFSSPAIIAKELEIPTAYFLSGNSIESNSIVDGIEFITDRTNLLDFIMKYRTFE